MGNNKDSPTNASSSAVHKNHRVLALYKFVKIEEDKIPQLKQEIETKLRSVKARGTILIAREGINGTICYPEQLAIESLGENKSQSSSHDTYMNHNNHETIQSDAVLEFLQNHEYFNGLRTRLSFADMSIFHRLKVKIKNQIVTMTGDDDDDDNDNDDEVDCANNNNNKVKVEKNNENKGIEDDDVQVEIDAVTNEKMNYSKDSNNNSSNISNNNSNNSNNCNPTKKSTREKIKVDPTEVVGTYVKPGKEWDELLMDPDVVVIDTRNKYEYDIGTFENAISPNTDNFRQFPDWLHKFSNACDNAEKAKETETGNNNINSNEQCVMNDKLETTTNPRSRKPILSLPKINRKPKAVAMFCTGGIRCEKSTSYAIASQVFDKDVPIYHLDGGVLAYLDHNRDPDKSKWKGECFVFDQRVALTHGLKQSTSYNSCHGCKRPISEEDKKGKDYCHGVHCKHCKDTLSDKQIQRFQHRQKQMELAEQKGTTHFYDPKETS